MKSKFDLNKKNNIMLPLRFRYFDICLNCQQTSKKFYDIFGSKIYFITELLLPLPESIEEVIIHFSLDRLDASVQPVPHIVDGNF